MKAIIYQCLPNAKRIKFHIPYQALAWRAAVKQLNGSFYHKPQRLWSIINTEDNLNRLKSIFKNEYIIKENDKTKNLPHRQLDHTSLETIAHMEQKLILKGYSPHTVRNYTNNFAHFLSYFEGRVLTEITKEEIEGFVYKLIVNNKISETKQNALINAIKFYYEKVLGLARERYDISRPKKSKTLPNVLSEKDVKNIISSIKNIKHRVIICCIYSAGLRLGEVVNLRLDDIHSEDGYIFIKGAKGKKDRRSILADHLLVMLRTYYVQYRPSYWLFEGADGGQYSTSSIQKLFRKAVKNANVNPWATIHTLRHSFATHMIQKGVNLRYVQTMLGHESPKTTEIYTKVMHINNRRFKSPLDDLFEVAPKS